MYQRVAASSRGYPALALQTITRDTFMTAQHLTSRCVLKALTAEARSALRVESYTFDDFPFRVGRDTRNLSGTVPRGNPERREHRIQPNNELYLIETGPEVFVSREHFLIDLVQGEYRLVDRLSALGTWVEGRLIGGDRRGGESRLLPGDVVIPGSFKSGFIFKFLVGKDSPS